MITASRVPTKRASFVAVAGRNNQNCARLRQMTSPSECRVAREAESFAGKNATEAPARDLRSVSHSPRSRGRGTVYARGLHAGGDLLDDGDVAVTARPGPVRVLMAEALRHALAGPERRVELMRVVVVVGVVHPLKVPLAYVVLDHVQRHVQGLRLGQPGSRRRRAGARRRRWYDPEARQSRPRQDRRRRLPPPADQEEQGRAAQGTQGARVVAHPRAARVHVTCRSHVRVTLLQAT